MDGCIGDSLNRDQETSTAPSKFVKCLQTWFEACFEGPFKNCANTLAHAFQDDEISCGIIAVNTLEHAIFGRPLWHKQNASKERVAWFRRLALAAVRPEEGQQTSAPEPIPIDLHTETGHGAAECESASHTDTTSLPSSNYPKSSTASLTSLFEPAEAPSEQSVTDYPERPPQYLSAVRQYSFIIRRFPWTTPLIKLAEFRLSSIFSSRDGVSEGGYANTNEEGGWQELTVR